MTIELWMLLRALELLQNVSNVKFALFRESETGMMEQLNNRLKTKAVITNSMRETLWREVSLKSFVGYRSTTDEILMVTSNHLTQDSLQSIMSTIIQQEPNYRKDEIWNNNTSPKTAGNG